MTAALDSLMHLPKSIPIPISESYSQIATVQGGLPSRPYVWTNGQLWPFAVPPCGDSLISRPCCPWCLPQQCPWLLTPGGLGLIPPLPSSLALRPGRAQGSELGISVRPRVKVREPPQTLSCLQSKSAGFGSSSLEQR